MDRRHTNSTSGERLWSMAHLRDSRRIKQHMNIIDSTAAAIPAKIPLQSLPIHTQHSSAQHINIAFCDVYRSVIISLVCPICCHTIFCSLLLLFLLLLRAIYRPLGHIYVEGSKCEMVIIH